MATLTVGIVAAIINLLLFIAHVWGPTGLAFILAGLTRDQETASSWNVIDRSLGNTYWPDITRSDNSHAAGVRKILLGVSLATPAFAALITVAGIVTPIGLSDSIEPGSRKSAQFAYIADPSSFGSSTSIRGKANFSRICTWDLPGTLLGAPAPCPYSDSIATVTYNQSTDATTFLYPWSYNITIPDILRDVFSSGTKGIESTISNFFDIEWRQLSTNQDDHYQNGSRYVVGIYRQIETLIQDEDIKVVEGLVVDTKNGGLGFRNHTLPSGVGIGAVWEEDLLFIQPETQCVKLNLSMDFDVASNSSESLNTSTPTTYLVDQGGLLYLPHDRPDWDHSNPQMNPDLRRRAARAAWSNNANSMFFFGLAKPEDSPYPSNDTTPFNSSYVGKRYPISSSGSPVPKDGIGASQTYGNYMQNLFISSQGLSYPNPFNITITNMTLIGMACSGQDSLDIANITNILVVCGLIRGAPQRLNPGSPLVWDAGSRWSSPLYSCATANKANIKTVTFRLNGTDGLKSLAVDRIEDKTYKDNSMAPLWGMEDSGRPVANIDPIWGLVSPDYQNFPNVSTIRKPEFYLPGYAGDGLQIASFSDSSSGSLTNLPAAYFYRYALGGAYGGNSYQEALPGIDTAETQLDYSGHSSVALFRRWQQLSSTESGMASIINLIWTDIAAPSVVSTKGTLGPGNNGAQNEVSAMHVQPFIRKVKYNWAFAIPALIVMALLLVITAIGVALGVLGISNLSIMKKRLRETSPGRIYTVLLHPGETRMDIPSREWAETMGRTEVAPDLLTLPNTEGSGLLASGKLEEGAEEDASVGQRHRLSQGDAKYGALETRLDSVGD